ncbi:MAG: DUF805 domain-containing protein [Rhizobiaceae bacterium]
MRGEVLHYDDNIGQGFISGDDGNRYSFARADMQQLQPIGKGTRVDFAAKGDYAQEIFIVESAQAATPPAQFGRFEAAAPSGEALGLFGYFKRAITTDYVNFRARARRKEFWGYMLFVYVGIALVVAVGAVFDAAIGNFDSEEPYLTIGLGAVAWLAIILPSIAVMVRRQHDIGLSGWFYLLILVPYIGGLILFVFSLIPSQKHENKWGPVPAGVKV